MLIIIHIVSFYALGILYYGIGYVRPAIQIVTNPLPTLYCIFSTTYATTIYIVNNKQQKLQNIRNNCKTSKINKIITNLCRIC